MKPPRNYCRRARPMLAPVIMDLLGMTQDGTLYLWQARSKVQPMDRFPTTAGKRILSGHYVLEMRGQVVAAYIANAIEPRHVTVQVMCRDTLPVTMPRLMIEGDVLGRVIPDPEVEAEISDMLRRLTDDALARQTAPHRKRGPA